MHDKDTGRRHRLRVSEVGSADRYRRTAPLAGAYRSDAAARRSSFRLTVAGRVGCPSVLTYDDLVAMATHRPNGEYSVSLLDVLSRVELATSAELLLAGDAAGGSLAAPLRSVLSAPRSHLVLGARRGPLREHDGGPVRLHIAGWTPTARPFGVLSLRAVTFAEFVRCP